eukprot:1843834-Pleurochrysis_carterae.AAC.2
MRNRVKRASPRLHDLALRGHRPLLELVWREVSRPRVEDLHHLRARVDLVDGVLRDALGKEREDVAHQLRIGLAQLAHLGEAVFRAGRPLHQVRTQREG